MRSFLRPIVVGVLFGLPTLISASPAQARSAGWRVAAIVLGRSRVAEIVRAQEHVVLTVGDRFDGSIISRISEDGVSLDDGRFLGVSGETRPAPAAPSGFSSPQSTNTFPSPAPVVYVTINGHSGGSTGYGYGGYALYYGGIRSGYTRVVGPPPGQANIPPPLGRAPIVPNNSGGVKR